MDRRPGSNKIKGLNGAFENFISAKSEAVSKIEPSPYKLEMEDDPVWDHFIGGKGKDENFRTNAISLNGKSS